jgi:hypothetical protein
MGGYFFRLSENSATIFEPARRPMSCTRTSVALLLQIREEIDDLRQGEGHWRSYMLFLPDKVHLPVSPFDSRQPISDVGRKSFAVGVLLFTQEKSS